MPPSSSTRPDACGFSATLWVGTRTPGDSEGPGRSGAQHAGGFVSKPTRRYLPSRSTGTSRGSVRAERRPPSNGRRGRLLALRSSTSRRSCVDPRGVAHVLRPANSLLVAFRLPRTPPRRRSRAPAPARARPRPRARCRRSEPPRSGSRRSRRRRHRRRVPGRWSTGRSSAPRRWRERPRGGPGRAFSYPAGRPRPCRGPCRAPIPGSPRRSAPGCAASLCMRPFRLGHFTPAARPRHHADCVKFRRVPALGLDQSELAGAFDRAVAGGDVELAVDGHRL